MRLRAGLLFIALGVSASSSFAQGSYSVMVRCSWPGLPAEYTFEPAPAAAATRIVAGGKAVLTIAPEQQSIAPQEFGCWQMGSMPPAPSAESGAAFGASYEKSKRLLTLESVDAKVTVEFGSGGEAGDELPPGKAVTMKVSARNKAAMDVLASSITVTPNHHSGLVFTTRRGYEAWTADLSAALFSEPALNRLGDVESAVSAAMRKHLDEKKTDPYLQVFRALFALRAAKSGAAAVPVLIQPKSSTKLTIGRAGQPALNVGAEEVVVICPDSTCELVIGTK